VHATSTEGATLLGNYVDFVFENPAKSEGIFIYEQICNNWHSLLKKNIDTDNSIKFSWFWLQIMYKSVAMKVGPQLGMPSRFVLE
jgi:hypothetical protein